VRGSIRLLVAADDWVSAGPGLDLAGLLYQARHVGGAVGEPEADPAGIGEPGGDGVAGKVGIHLGTGHLPAEPGIGVAHVLPAVAGFLDSACAPGLS